MRGGWECEGEGWAGKVEGEGWWVGNVEGGCEGEGRSGGEGEGGEGEAKGTTSTPLGSVKGLKGTLKHDRPASNRRRKSTIVR